MFFKKFINMKSVNRKTIFFLMISVMIVSCQNTNVIKNVLFEGELYAKNTIGVKYDIIAPDISTTYQWFIADAPSGEWKILQGIHTHEIVLLMDYAGKYLKCEITALKNEKKVAATEIVSKQPISDRGNPNADWFRDAGLGLMVHFLKGCYTGGGSKEWNEIVDGFDVALFAEQCKESGVNYVLWALGQNDGYYNSPNSAYDKITSVKAGDLCSKRDLPADLIKALKQKGIKFMFYLPGNPPIDNEEVVKKFQYTYRKDSPTSQFTQECWESVIREWSLRYGRDLYGWWFDGMYRGGIIETRSDMSLKYNISTHTLAAKAGNPQSIVTYNYGVAKIQSDSPYDDYSAGEENNIIQIPDSRWTLPGIQWFHFTHLGEYWARPGIKNKTTDLEAWSRKVFEKEGVLCFDVFVTSKGDIDPQQREQLRAIASILREVRK
jgi:hypothetical protein